MWHLLLFITVSVQVSWWLNTISKKNYFSNNLIKIITQNSWHTAFGLVFIVFSRSVIVTLPSNLSTFYLKFWRLWQILIYNTHKTDFVFVCYQNLLVYVNFYFFFQILQYCFKLNFFKISAKIYNTKWGLFIYRI